MKSKKVLLQIVEHLDAFEAENKHLKDYDLADFVSYLHSRVGGAQPSIQEGETKEVNLSGIQIFENNANLISRLLSLSYRYTKEYSKKGLIGSELQSLEEFSYMIALLAYKDLTKTELIQKNAMVKTSGIEIIKRLLKKGFIHQFIDDSDKRSRRVAVTPEGMAEMRKVFPRMQMVSDVIKGNLNSSEQKTLIFLLQKLTAYHKDIFINHFDKDLSEIDKMRG